jgi:hypothetical protein
MPLEDAAARIASEKPDAVGLCCYIWNIAFIKKLLPLLKSALPDAVIILGGPEVSFNAGDILNDITLADYVIAGEGERPFAVLLNAINTGRNAADIPGVCCRTSGGTIVKSPHCPADIPPTRMTTAISGCSAGVLRILRRAAAARFPARSACRDAAGASVISRLSARNRSSCIWQTAARKRSSGRPHVQRRRERARELFSFIIDNFGVRIPKGIRVHFEIAGDLLDAETLALLKTAPPGLFQFEIGLQSFNAETLALIDRKTDVERLKSNIKRLMSFGNIHVHVDLIAGCHMRIWPRLPRASTRRTRSDRICSSSAF